MSLFKKKDFSNVPVPRHPNWRKLRAFVKSHQDEIDSLAPHCPCSHTGNEILFVIDDEANLEAAKRHFPDVWPSVRQAQLSELFGVKEPLLMIPATGFELMMGMAPYSDVFPTYMATRAKISREGGNLAVLDLGPDREVFWI